MPAVPRTLRLLAVPMALCATLTAANLAVEPAAGQDLAGSAAAAGAPADCNVGSTVVDNTAGAANWTPRTRSRWRFTASEVIQTRPGTPPPGPRRPAEYAILRKGGPVRSVQIDAEVRIDTPVQLRNRDVVVIFGYRSPTRFYYVHLSTDNTSYPHNGIFVVNDADRLRIDDQWNGSVGASPAITDAAYHDVRVRHCTGTGEIAVYVDGSSTPLMTATDTTFNSGRVGFGSFDNVGRTRNLTLIGTPA